MQIVYVHGKSGSAGESEHYKPLFPNDEVIGLDYHTFSPWETGVEIRAAVDELARKHEDICLIANSIGAFFSMNAGLDGLIQKAREIIHTEFGEDLSWEYLSYVRSHPIKWNVPTQILFGEKDQLTSLATMKDFVEKYHAGLTVMENGEHWFHTEEQMAFLDDWIRRENTECLYNAQRPCRLR